MAGSVDVYAFQLLGPTGAISAGSPVTLHGIAPGGTSAVRIEAAPRRTLTGRRSPRSRPRPTARSASAVTPDAPGHLPRGRRRPARACRCRCASARALDTRVTRLEGRALQASAPPRGPPRPARRAALQLYSRERFRWRQVAHATRRPQLARVVHGQPAGPLRGPGRAPERQGRLRPERRPDAAHRRARRQARAAHGARAAARAPPPHVATLRKLSTRASVVTWRLSSVTSTASVMPTLVRRLSSLRPFLFVFGLSTIDARAEPGPRLARHHGAAGDQASPDLAGRRGRSTSTLSLPRRSELSLRTPIDAHARAGARPTPSTPPRPAARRRRRCGRCARSRAGCPGRRRRASSTSAVSAPTPQLTVSASPSRAWMKSEPPVHGSAVQTLSPSNRSSPGAALEVVLAGRALDAVVAGAAEELVVAGAAVDDVAAAEAVDAVVARVAEQLLGRVCAGQHVVERRADERLDVAVRVVALARGAVAGRPSRLTLTAALWSR